MKPKPPRRFAVTAISMVKNIRGRLKVTASADPSVVAIHCAMAGIAFLGAGLLTGQQPFWFAVAALSFAVSIVTALLI